MQREAQFNVFAWSALLLLFCFQVWWPQVAYPGTGMLLASGFALVLAVSSLVRLRTLQSISSSALANPAAWAGFAFFVYVWVRWGMDGFPSVGAEFFGTLVGSATCATATYFLLSTRPSGASPGKAEFTGVDKCAGTPLWNLCWFYALLCVLVIACAVYAAAQFFVLYGRSYEQLIQEIGNRRPDLTEMALLHHFQLKRVASVWGDPNAYAGFCAMTLPAALYFIVRGRSALLKGLGVAAMAGALTGVALSGSRGGILNLLFVFTCWAAYLAICRRSAAGIAALLLIVLVLGAVPNASRAQTEITTSALPSSTTTESAWAWRASTIRERLYYWGVGRKMLAQRPLLGMGLGSVDLYFGRYKPPEARESRYLHNWLLQIAAELGMVGLVLAVAFISLLAFGVLSNRSWSAPQIFPAALGIAALLLDALLQLSFNQRELMALFGIFCGVLLNAGARTAHGIATARVRSFAASGLLILAFLLHVVPQLAAKSRLQLAEDLIREGSLADARLHARRAQALSPRDPASLLVLAAVEESEGNLSAARLHLEKALSLQPESASIRSALANVWQQLGDFEQAEHHLSEALARYPSNWRYHDQMSRLAEKRGLREEACSHARLAVQFGVGLAGTDHLKGRLGSLGCAQ